MRIKKFVLGLAAMVLMFSLLPKSYAVINNVSRFEVEIRKGRFYCILSPTVKKGDRLKLLKGLNN